jgi:hypothetical protein
MALTRYNTKKIANFIGDTGSGGRTGLVPAPAAGDGAAGRVLKADGTWGAGGGGGGGDVAGAASSVNNTVPRFSGTTGKSIKTSPVVVGDAGEIEQYLAKIVNDATTARTLAATDTGTVIIFTGSSAITVTLPNNLSVGFNCTIIQSGTGQVTFSAAGGATFNSRQSHTKTAGQHAVTGLMVTANSGGTSANYNLSGDTAA